MTAVDSTGEKVVVSGESVFPGPAGDDAVRTLLSLALSDPRKARDRFPDYRLTRLVLTRFDMDDVEAMLAASGIMTDLRGSVLRIGFGLYHDEADVPGMAYRIAACVT